MIYENVELSGSLNISGSFQVPYGVSGSEPTSPSYGSLFFNTTDEKLYVWEGSWEIVGAQVQPLPSANIEYLVVAGGASGGSNGGGGGAGGYLSSSLSSIESGSQITVTVGAGGSNSVAYQAQGNDGSDSSIASAAGTSFTTITSTGGGGGASNNLRNGRDGGSGGGAAIQNTGTGTGGSGTVGQGNNGGDTTTTGHPYVGAGGGGANAAGGDGGGSSPGDGGNGETSSITGISTTYAGGGGGTGGTGVGYTGPGGSGGTGGGGAGGVYNGNGTNATANTGGGGGASGDATTVGAGGSGVVILAYDSGSINGVGGLTGDAGNGKKYHQFNSSGTFKTGNTSDFRIKTANLQVHYDAGNFDSRGTSTWTDLQGTSNGTVVGATLGNNFYYNFNGSSYVSTGIDHSSFNSLTYIIWLYVDSNTAGSQISGGNGSYRNKGQLGIKTSANRFDYISIGADYFRHALSVDTGWHHFAVTDNGDGSLTAATLYIDTTSVSYTNPVVNGSYLNNTNIQIGRGMKNTGAFDYDFNGNIAQVRIYNTVLTPSEITTDYNATKTNFV